MKRKLSLSESGLSDELPPWPSTSRSSRRRGRRGTLSSSASPFHRLFALCLSSTNSLDATTHAVPSTETTLLAGSPPQRVADEKLPHSSPVFAEATSRAIAPPPPVEVPTAEQLPLSDRRATFLCAATATLTTRDQTQTDDNPSQERMYAGEPYHPAHEQVQPRYPAPSTTLAQPALVVGTSVSGDLYDSIAYGSSDKHSNSPPHQTGFQWDNSSIWSPTLSMASASPSLQTPALTSASSSSLSSSHETISTLPSSALTHFSALPPTSLPPVGYSSAASTLSLASPPHSGEPLALSAGLAGTDAGGLAATPFSLSGDARPAYDNGPDAQGELQHFAMDEDVQRLRMPPGMLQMDPAGGPAEERRTKKATLPPADVQRRGEDLGLTLGDFDMLDTLGTGTFGRVILVRLRTAPSRPQQTQPHYFALKVLEKNTIVRLRQVEHVNSERTTLSHVNHPFVVNLFCTFQDEANLYMLLEFVQGGELFSHLRRAGRFSADVARFYVANLILVLDHLHQQDIIYRDLKPENLLIGADGHIKVTDFGFAKYVQDRTFTLCGTPEYLAPEIITATGHGAAADWWALGVLLFELLAGYPPFFADNPLEIYEKILKGKFSVPAHIDPVAKDLIRRLLTSDLTQRLGNLRNGAQDVMEHPWFEGVDWAAVERKEIRAPIIPLTNVPGDASNFERFPACSLESMPGVLRALSQRQYGYQIERGSDPYGYLFPNF